MVMNMPEADRLKSGDTFIVTIKRLGINGEGVRLPEKSGVCARSPAA